MSHPIADPKSRRLSQREPRSIRARYDAAQTTDFNRRHWAAADGLSAKAANNVAVRKVLRTRARYEEANNSNLQGIVETLGIDTVGPSGPRLQMLTDDPALNSVVEERFEEWAEEVEFAEKLRIMRETACVSGECFVLFVTNPALDAEVKLDLQLFEGDQFTDPTWQSETSPQWTDGISFDAYENPVSYRKLLYHPGDLIWGANPFEYEDIPAKRVFHYFKRKRPGQRRGIPEFTAALSNWPDLRRYCEAVIAAAETAADHAMTIQSTAPTGDPDDDDTPEAMDTIELKKGLGTVLPKGYTLGQTRAEQPTTTYSDFTDKKVAEGARCLSMPFSIAALDSSKATTSARYVDGQLYAKGIKLSRRKINRLANRVLDAWLTEARRIPDFLPADPERWPHQWNWPSTGEHADPDKVASAQGQRLRNGTSCIQDECAEEGRDWEDVQAKIAASLGLTLEQYRERVLIPNMLTNPPARQAAGAGEEPPATAAGRGEPPRPKTDD